MWHGEHRAGLTPIWNDKNLLEPRSKHFRISEYLRRDMRITDHRTFAANWNELGVHPVQQVMYLSLARSLLCVPSRCLSDFLSAVFLSVCLFVGQSIGRSFCLSACLPVCPTVCLSVCLSFCWFVCLYVCLPDHTHTRIHTHTYTHTHTNPICTSGKGESEIRCIARHMGRHQPAYAQRSDAHRLGRGGAGLMFNHQLWIMCRYKPLYVYMYTYIHVHTNVHVCVLCVCVYVFQCECVCLYVYTHIYKDIFRYRIIDVSICRHIWYGYTKPEP